MSHALTRLWNMILSSLCAISITTQSHERQNFNFRNLKFYIMSIFSFSCNFEVKICPKLAIFNFQISPNYQKHFYVHTSYKNLNIQKYSPPSREKKFLGFFHRGGALYLESRKFRVHSWGVIYCTTMQIFQKDNFHMMKSVYFIDSQV